MASPLPRKLYGGSFTRYKANAKTSLVSFCTKSLSFAEREADSDSDSDCDFETTCLSSSNQKSLSFAEREADSDSDSDCDFETTCLSSSNQLQFTSNTERTLENGNIDWAIGTCSHTKDIKEWEDSDLLKARIS